MSNLLISAQQSRAASLEAVEAILAKAESEKRTLTEEETTALRGHQAEVKRFDEQIDVLRSVPRQEQRAERSPISVRANIEDKPWTVGEFFRSVVQAEQRGAEVDPRLVQVRAGTGLHEGLASEGGFLVPETVATQLMQRAYDTGAVASRCNRMPVSTLSTVIPALNETSRADGSRGGGLRAFWMAENGAFTPSKPDFRRIRLEVKKLGALCYVTEEMLTDAPMIESYISQAFPQEMAFVLDDAIIRGDGNGKPIGILNHASKVRVSKEGSQSAATLLFKNVTKMWARMWGPSRRNAVWFINQDIEPQLWEFATSSSSPTPVFLPPTTGISGGMYSTLFGRPIIPIEQAATLGTEGDIILADLSQYILAPHTSGTRSQSSMHVRFLNDETVFKFTTRVDGQPWWPAALTPAQGSNSLSPFVTLETR